MTTLFDFLTQKRAKPHHASTKREGLYIARMLKNVDEWTAWAKAAGLPALDENLHVTQLFSSVGVQIPLAKASLTVERAAITGIGHLGKDNALVVYFDDATMTARFNEAIAAGAKTTYDSFKPHLTLCYDPDKAIDPSSIEIPDLSIELGPEYAGPLADDVFKAVQKERDAWAVVPPHIAEVLLELSTGIAAVRKADEWQQIVVGYGSVSETGDGRIVIDYDDEAVDLEALEVAIKETLAIVDQIPLYYRHGMADEREDVGVILEHYCLTKERKEALGLDAGVALGYLLAAHVTCERTWKEVLDGKLPMFSIGALVRAETIEVTTVFDWLCAGGV